MPMAPETPFGALDHNGRSGIQITSTRVGVAASFSAAVPFDEA